MGTGLGWISLTRGVNSDISLHQHLGNFIRRPTIPFAFHSHHRTRKKDCCTPRNPYLPTVVISVPHQYSLKLSGLQSCREAQAPSDKSSALDLTEAKLAQIKKDFQAGKQLLKRKGVPFEPEELLKPRWQKRLCPKFAQMPEMNVTRRLGKRLHGVQLADVLYLPEKVELTGDTFILARQVVFEGTHALIKGNYNVYFFPIEMEGVLGTTLEVAMKESGVADSGVSSRVGYNTASSTRRFVPRLLQDGWSIAIDTNGSGRKEWLEKQNRTGRVSFQKAAWQETINHNGNAGGTGPTGNMGIIGANGTPNPAPKGDNGGCGVGSFGRY